MNKHEMHFSFTDIFQYLVLRKFNDFSHKNYSSAPFLLCFLYLVYGFGCSPTVAMDDLWGKTNIVTMSA